MMTPVVIEVLKAAAGILLVMAAWLLVQSHLRKRAAADSDADMLEDMVHGCGACSNACSGCADLDEKEERNEPQRLRR